MRSLHCPAHHGYGNTLSKVSQRFWWPRVRGDVSAFINNCEVCDRDRFANPSPRTALGHLPGDIPFGKLFHRHRRRPELAFARRLTEVDTHDDRWPYRLG